MSGPSPVVVWEWLFSSTQWLPYPPEVSNYIDAAHSQWLAMGGANSLPVQSTISLQNLGAALAHFNIDLSTLSQINSSNGTVRPIRRTEYPAGSPPSNCVQWQWEGDKLGVWEPYSMEICALLEKAHHSRATSVDLNRHPYNIPYSVHLPKMVQIRHGSNFVRKVRRIPLSQPYTVVKFPLSFSPNSLASSGGLKSMGFPTPSNGLPSNGIPSNGFQYSSVFSNPFSLASGFSVAPLTTVAPPQLTGIVSGGLQGGSSTMGFSDPRLSTPKLFTIGTSPPATSGKRRRRLIRNLTPGYSHDRVVPMSVDTSTSQMFVTSSLPVTTNSWSWSNIFGSSSATNQSTPSSSLFGAVQGGVNGVMSACKSVFNDMSIKWPQQQNSSVGFPPSVPGFGQPASNSFGLFPSQPTAANGNSSFPGAPPMQSIAANGGSSFLPGAPPTQFLTANDGPPSMFSGNSIRYAASDTSMCRLPAPSAMANVVHQENARNVTNVPTKEVLKDFLHVVPQPPKDEDCCICVDGLCEVSGYGGPDEHTVVKLFKCSHMFHLDCISAMYNSGTKDGGLQCPTCKSIYGVKRGNCPDGSMTYRAVNNQVPGYEGCGAIEIIYSISAGYQNGKRYAVRGFPRYAYLPNNDRGRHVLGLLAEAWKRRLTFTIGTSVTTGESDTVVWNEIHHKTSITNERGHGYPDPNYLDNVIAELAAQGVEDN